MSGKVFTPPPIFPLVRGGSQKEILQMSSKVLTPPPALPLVRGGSQIPPNKKVLYYSSALNKATVYAQVLWFMSEAILPPKSPNAGGL
jgi:hypothetical protein